MPLKVDVIRDRGAMGREIEDGWIENVYRLQIMNQDETPRSFTVSASGMPGIVVSSQAPIALDAAATRSVALALRIPPGAHQSGSHPIEITVQALDQPDISVREDAVFLIPRP